MILDPISPIRAVVIDSRARDKALDATKMDLGAYLKSRDPALVVCRDGANPAWFSLDPVDVIFVGQFLDSISAESEKRMFAFRASCRSVDCGGEKIEAGELVQNAYGTRVASMDFVRAVARKYSLHAVYEMGDIAIQRSKLPEGAQGPFGWSAI